jgi:hypothetical protein
MQHVNLYDIHWRAMAFGGYSAAHFFLVVFSHGLGRTRFLLRGRDGYDDLHSCTCLTYAQSLESDDISSRYWILAFTPIKISLNEKAFTQIEHIIYPWFVR